MEICTSHYKENLEWLRESPWPVTVVTHENGDTVPSIFKNIFTVPNTGYEVSAYAKFIIERYDTLPDFTVFIHGHETSYHQNSGRHPIKLIKDANIEKYEYIPLGNTWRIVIPSRHGLDETMHDNVFSCCTGAEFIVSKNRIRKYSIEFYKNMLEKYQSKNDCIKMEHYWHVLFDSPSMFPKDDMFNPPIPEILYHTSSLPFSLSELKFGYIGSPPSPTGTIHIQTAEEYEFYAQRGTVFIMYHGMEAPFDLKDPGNINTIINPDTDMWIMRKQVKEILSKLYKNG